LASALAIAAPAAQAANWNYSWDSFNDGTGHRTQNGGNGTHGVGYQSDFEMFGLAVLEDIDAGTVTFAFNSNIALDGWGTNPNIGMGDLFINLDPSKTFSQVEGTDSLLAIRFASSNDSGLSGTGVFSGVTGKDVTSSNSGWSSYGSYENYVTSKGGTVEYLDGLTNAAAKSYLGAHADTVAQGGTKLGDVTVLDAVQLASMGLNFAGAAGTQTYGFTFARSLLPAGELNWMAHLMAECANDVMGTSGTFAEIPPDVEVPEPAAAVALMLVGAGMLGARKRR